MTMKLVGSTSGYDFYIGRTLEKNMYNIVPSGSKPPSGGYYYKEYIEEIKHVRFSDIKASK